MSPGHLKYSTGTLDTKLRRFRHSSHNGEKNNVNIYVFKKYSWPHEKGNLFIHSFVFEISQADLILFFQQ